VGRESLPNLPPEIETPTPMSPHDKPLEHLRSSHWPKVRAEYLEQHPTCEVCGATEKLNVHHILPFHLHPQLELDPDNLITLCEDEAYVNCHLFVGHLANFRGYNPDVVKDAAEWNAKLKANQERIHETAEKEK
jgi:5-methylcytosine-specific restriction protein A